MKNAKKILAVILMLALSAGPAFAFVETIETAPGKTLDDFQRAYSGTKPLIGWQKFQQYEQLQNAPQPTLEPSRMRVEPAIYGVFFESTKPIVQFTRKHEAEAKGLIVRFNHPGTKPVVHSLKGMEKS